MRDVPIKSAQRIGSGDEVESLSDAVDLRPAQHRLSADVEPSCADWRGPRFAEIDAQIRAEDERRQNNPQPKRKPRRRSAPHLPAGLIKEITHLARAMKRKYALLFLTDAKLKERAARWFRSQLPPWGKRGAQGYDEVTFAIELLRKFRRHYARQYPDEKPPQIGKRVWKRICLEVLRDYSAMTETAQRDAREKLRGRVRDRLNKQRRARRESMPFNFPPVTSSQSV